MNKFDERKQSFEKKFARDQELRFKVEARSNKYLGEWASLMLGKNDREEEAKLKDLGQLQKIKEYIKKRKGTHSFKEQQSWKKINMIVTVHEQLILDGVGAGEEKDIYETVYYLRGGMMPAWNERLDDNTIRQLAIYVHQLGGGEADDVDNKPRPFISPVQSIEEEHTQKQVIQPLIPAEEINNETKVMEHEQ